MTAEEKALCCSNGKKKSCIIGAAKSCTVQTDGSYSKPSSCYQYMFQLQTFYYCDLVLRLLSSEKPLSV